MVKKLFALPPDAPPNPQIDRLYTIVNRADGEPLHRFGFAYLMTDLESDEIKKECNRLPIQHREMFMMACQFWELSDMEYGFRLALTQQQSIEVCLGIWDNVKKYGRYEAGIAEKMWESEREVVYRTFPPKKDSIWCPLPELIYMASVVGRPFPDEYSQHPSLDFMVWSTVWIPRVVESARDLAQA